MTHHKYSSQRGFALLITLLTVGVIVSATLAIVELSRMQLKLSVDSRDAEIAFSAANAAKECGQYVRTFASSTIAMGGSTQFNCFGRSSNVSSNATGIVYSGSGTAVHRYQAVMNWSTGDRCSVVDIIAVYPPNSANTTIGGAGNNSLRRIVSNYPSDSLVCPAGAQCTIIAVAGYNATCANRNGAGVLKRELLLQF